MFVHYRSRMIRWLSDKFGAAFVRDTALIFAAVFITVESVVATYYGIFEPDRLVGELVISGAMTVLAGLPAIWLLVRRSNRADALSYRLRRLNDLDQMTGLLNKQAFLRDMQKHLEYLPSSTSAGAFAHIEIESSRTTAEPMGDYERDRAIRVIATTIKEATRTSDVGVRLADQQFGIFLRDASGAKAAEITKRLLSEISRRRQQIGLTGQDGAISIGIAAHRPGDNVRVAMHEAAQSLTIAGAKQDSVVIHFRSVRAA